MRRRVGILYLGYTLAVMGCSGGSTGNKGDTVDVASSEQTTSLDTETHLSGGSETEGDTGTASVTETEGDTGTASVTETEGDTGTAGVTETEGDTGTASVTETEGDTGTAGATDMDGDTENGTTERGSNTDSDNDTDSDSSTAMDTEADAGLEWNEQLSMSYILDPYDAAPLVAVAKVSHEALIPQTVTEITVVINGIDEDAEDLTAHLNPASSKLQEDVDIDGFLEPDEVGIPILGLYPDHQNEIHIEIRTDTDIFSGDMTIPTEPLSTANEVVTVHVANVDRMEPGWTYLNNRVYDEQGYCRWKGPRIFHILKNGNLMDQMNEMGRLGNLIRTPEFPDHLWWHHDTIELPNGNLLMCVNNDLTSVTDESGDPVTSVEDYIIEMDADTDEIVNAWDMRAFLDVSRGVIIKTPHDWFHMNTLGYDEYDDSILVSSRYQGVVKLSRGGIQGDAANQGKEMKWILSPHLDWGPAGPDEDSGIDPNDYLLTSVDRDGVPYAQSVQDNLETDPQDPESFYWPIGQHGLQITAREEGKLRLLVFNNQASFIFDGPGTIDNGTLAATIGDLSNDRADPPFSQIVEYEIDEVAMTVRKVWSYGEYQSELYGDYNGGTTFLEQTGNRMLLTNGRDRQMSGYPFNPHIVEVTPEGEEVFHLEITRIPISARWTGRIHLYSQYQ